MVRVHNVHINDTAFQGFQLRAASIGLSVDDYLNELGTARAAPDGFVITPEIRRAIERGIIQADRGEVFSLDESRRDIAKAHIDRT